MTFALAFPAIDPVLFEFGPVVIRWYALAYIAGLLIGWRLMRALAARPPYGIDPERVDDFLTWATIGVIVGGRLGYVLFYNFDYYMGNPVAIFKVWQGGMSFHGGLAGLAVAIYFFARHYKIPVLAFAAGGGSWTLLKQIGLIFIRNTPLTERKQIRALYATLVMMAEISIYLGIIGTLIGSVLILQNVSNAKDLPPAMAVNILTLLYGVILYLIFRVAAAKVRRMASAK